MRVALGLLIASATAALGIVESSLASQLREVVEMAGLGANGEVVVKGAIASAAAIMSLWGIALGARRFRGARARRVAIILSSVGVSTAMISLLWLGLNPVTLMIVFPALGVFLGLAAFAASNTIYDDVDYTLWRNALAGYYIVSSLGSSLLLLAHIEGIALYIIPLTALVSGAMAAALAGSSPIPYTSLKVLENFATAAALGPRFRGRGFKLYEIARIASALGALSAVKLTLMVEAQGILGPTAPLVYSASYSIGVGLAALEPSLTLASLIAITSLAFTTYIDNSVISLAAVSVALGYSTLTLVYYVLDTAPRRLRVASVMTFMWTAAASAAVALLAPMLEVAPSAPALAIALIGFAVAEKLRPRGIEWGATQ
ncbi:MAG: hypothetical protein F7B17_02760 [Desulfurococcales archaeon]|nr:hypothetical protein [Desulfurococcales archaeon]